MLWFAIYLPVLPLQVFRRGTPEAQPLAVLEHGRVRDANPAAQRLGVRAGLSQASARALSPALAARSRDPGLEEAALAEIAAWAGRYTPVVSLDPPGTLLLEAGASLRLFGGARALAADIRSGCREMGFEVQVAAAPTPLAARWLARAGRDVIVIEREALAQAVDPLPLEVAEGPPEALEMLLSIGTLTIGECRRLPRAGLARRGAQELLDRIDRALGRLPDPRPTFVPPPVYEARMELGVPQAQADALDFALARLFAGLSAWLAARHAGVERFRLRLTHEGREATLLPVTLGAASREAARFARLARSHLARTGLAAPVCALALEADEILPLAEPSGELFARSRDAGEGVTEVIERLRARLGEDAVFGLQSVAEHRPERAGRNTRDWSAHAPDALPPGPRPLWLLERPRSLAAGAGAPLPLVTGPERIESGWWEDAPEARVRRDYHIARGTAGELLWVYRERGAGGAWYLHGIFA